MRETSDSQPTSKPKEALPTGSGVSRRDFIRRASKEVVDTGTKIVPGAAVTRKVLGLDAGPDPATGEPPKGLMQRFAAWREGRRKESTE